MTDSKPKLTIPPFPASRGPLAAKHLSNSLPRLEQARRGVLAEMDAAEEAFLAAVDSAAASDENRDRIRRLAK